MSNEERPRSVGALTGAEEKETCSCHEIYPAHLSSVKDRMDSVLPIPPDKEEKLGCTRRADYPPMLAAALILAVGYGKPVFPCCPETKKPLVPNGFKDADTNEWNIRAMWGSNIDAMIGVPTGKQSPRAFFLHYHLLEKNFFY